MKRRSFLKSVVGLLCLPFLPKSEAKTTITDSKPIIGEFGSFGHIRWISGQEFPPSATPISDDIDFLKGDQWTKEERIRMTLDAIELAIKRHNTKYNKKLSHN